MKLVTVATSSEGYFPYLLESCKRFNTDLVVLGWGQKWLGFTWRSKLLIKYLDTLKEDDIVCFIDAYDVIQLRPLDEMEELFKTISKISNRGLVVGCDKYKSPEGNLGSLLYYGTCQKKRINAGTYIGYVRIIRKLLAYNLKFDDSSDDQVNMINFCKTDPAGFHIDCDNLFFLTIVKAGRDIVQKDMIINKDGIIYDGVKPFFLHGPGFANMNNAIEKSGYIISNEEKKRLTKYVIKAMSQRIYYFKNKVFFVIVAILCLILVSMCIRWARVI